MNLNQQKLEFFGIYGIFEGTIKLTFTATTIFTQITLAFILPLCLLIFTQSQVPNLWSIHTLPFNSTLFFFTALFFLLSTATTVYAAACTFADCEVSFYQLISVAPKLCKQLLITFLCLIVDFLAFSFVALSALVLISIAISFLVYDTFESLTQLLILMLSVEAFYFALIWQISSIVSVSEAESYGFEAIARSKELLQRKKAMASILLVLTGLPFGVILFVFRYVVVVESALIVREGILGIIWICSFLMFLLIGSVLYLVCKSYHLESIDKLELSAHLQGYLPMDCEPAKQEVNDDLDKSVLV